MANGVGTANGAFQPSALVQQLQLQMQMQMQMQQQQQQQQAMQQQQTMQQQQQQQQQQPVSPDSLQPPPRRNLSWSRPAATQRRSARCVPSSLHVGV